MKNLVLVCVIIVGHFSHLIAHGSVFSGATNSKTRYLETVYDASKECKSLVQRSDFQFTIISAKLIRGTDKVPPHCRLDGLIPTEIRFEVNLPLKWNGRIYMYGNGGLAGTPAIDPGKQWARDQALQRSFATAYTDTGHDKRVLGGGTFAYKNHHRLVDYGFRAVHLTIKTAKLVAAHFYDQEVNYSYWNGCSTGGRQAMISAQRFPNDFDGIIAGAPAADYSGLKFSQAWRTQAIGQSTLTEEKVETLGKIIYQQCDSLDGVLDGLISDPRRCDFAPRRDLPVCPDEGDTSSNCFDSREIDALEQYYSPVKLESKVIYPGMPVGSEVLSSSDGSGRVGWYPWLINPNGPTLLDALGSDFFRYMVTIKDDPSFDWNDFTFQEAPDNLAEFRDIVDAIDPDISAFKKSGGKMISYFGWADPDINPLTLINYYNEVKSIDASVDSHFRVYMVPGMFHCRGGPGPDSFDMMSPLIDWVEQNIAPEQIPAWKETKEGKQLTRPLCPYPKEALLAANKFQCKVPRDIPELPRP